MKSFTRIALGGAALLAASAALPSVSHADTFTFTSCELSAPPGCGTATNFGTVTLTQSGADVNVSVVLTPGNIFAATGAGQQFLFLFNDAVPGSTVTGATATVNGVDQTPPALTGVTNTTIVITAGGGALGTFTAGIECTLGCMGTSSPLGTVNDLHFTATNVTLAQLETQNAAGINFIADIGCGQTGCPAGGAAANTGLVNAVPGPILGAGLPGLIAACTGLVALARRRRKLVV